MDKAKHMSIPMPPSRMPPPEPVEAAQAPVTSVATVEHGADIEEIISTRMPFIVRWGTAIFCAVFLLLCIMGWLIQYPDVVTASGKLNSVNAPRKVVTKTDGKLMRIVVRENDLVAAGQVLGYMESTANANAVRALDERLDTLSRLVGTDRADEIEQFFPTTTPPHVASELGELQPYYYTFAEAFTQFKACLSKGFLQHKMVMLRADLQTSERLSQILNDQKRLLVQDLELTNKTYTANKALAENKVIALLDFRNEKSKLLAKQLTLPQINATIVANEASLIQKKKEIAELSNQISTQQYTFVQSLRTIKSHIQIWQAKYLLRAPVSGKVQFIGFFQDSQEMKSGQSLFYVQPHNSTYFIEVTIPQYNFGKVKLGQQVSLKFQAYPFAQYGVVIGKLQYIDASPTNNGYLAKVVLPNGLVTTRKQRLQFQHGLIAQVDIETENMRLLERLYYDLIKQIVA